MIYSENILLCISIPLLLTMLYSRGSIRRSLMAFLLGMVICLLSSYISGYLTLLTGMDLNESAVYISPTAEEIMKLLPLLFYMFVFRPKEMTLVTYSISLGAGFATFENCCYLLSVGSESLTFTLVRGLAVGVMHIVCMLAMSLSLIMVRRYRVFTLATVAGCLALSVVFHALYNLLVSVRGVPAYIGYSMPVLMALVFYWPYQKLREVSEHT